MRRGGIAIVLTALVAVMGVLTATAAGASGLPCGVLTSCPTTTVSAPPTVPPVVSTPTTTTTAAPPVAYPGALYEGHAGGAITFVEIRVSRTGRSATVVNANFGPGRCSNHLRYYAGGPFPAGRTLKIAASGRASATTGSVAQPLPNYTANTVIHGHERTTFAVTFAGNRLTGSLADTFSGPRGFFCAVNVAHFTLHRAGTAQAPLTTSNYENGRYVGTGSSVAVLSPVALIQSISFRPPFSCTNGYTTAESQSYDDLPIRDGRFGFSVHTVVPIEKGGGKDHATTVLRGRLFKRDGIYEITWRWLDHEIPVAKDGKIITDCRSSSQTYVAYAS